MVSMNRRGRAALAIAALAVVAVATPSAAQTPPTAHGPSSPAPPASGDAGADPADGSDSYIVVLTDDAPPPAEHAVSVDAAPEHVYGHAIDGYSAHLDAAQVAELERDPDVAYITPDQRIELLDQSVPTGVRRVFADENPAIGIGSGDEQVVDADIAILDEAVEPLADLNVVDRVSCPAYVACVPRTDNTYVMDHGTHVAGIAAARDNGHGVVGVAPGARIWSVQVCSVGFCMLSNLLGGVDYVTAHADEIEVANMSLGGFTGDTRALDEAITASVDAGVVYTVAAGNEGIDAESIYPARHPDVVTVGALGDVDGEPGGTGGPVGCVPGEDDHLAVFSNWGPTVEVVAPGTCILSYGLHGTLVEASGTSMAAPHAAGAAALLTSGADAPDDRSGVLAVRDALIASGNLDWTWESRGPGDVQRPVVDVGDPSLFSPTLLDAEDLWMPRAVTDGGALGVGRAQCATDPTGVYTIAGMRGLDWSPSTATRRWDTATGMWTERAPYPGDAGARVAAACTAEGTIHVLGGVAGGSTRHDVYDTTTDTWTSLAPLGRPAAGAALGVWDGKVFAVGGSSGVSTAPTARVDVYDASTDSWRAGPALPWPASQTAFTQVGRHLYVVGGWFLPSPGILSGAALRLDMSTEAWETGPALPVGSADAALVATHEALYLLGGLSADPVAAPAVDSVRRLDLNEWEGGSWSALEPLPSPLAMLAGSCGPDGPNASIGAIGGVAMGHDPMLRNEHWETVADSERCGHLEP